jgi:hypothetical protein
MSHANALLTPRGRLLLARCVVEQGWPLRRAADRFQVSATTAARWAGRYREQGAAGMTDRSSRPHRSPRRTPTRLERRIIKVRVTRRWGPARIGFLLGLHPSTVHRVLSRYRLARLAWLDGGVGFLRWPLRSRCDRRGFRSPRPRAGPAGCSSAHSSSGSQAAEAGRDTGLRGPRRWQPRPTGPPTYRPPGGVQVASTPPRRRMMVR